jgi:thioredoxin reductase
MRVIVLGSGVIGVASAYYLAQQEHKSRYWIVKLGLPKKPVLVMQGKFPQVIRPLGQHQDSV